MSMYYNNLHRSNLPHTYKAISIPCKQRLSISAPRKTDTLTSNRLRSSIMLNLTFINNTLGFKIPDFDSSSGGCT